jgi:hypothetical protein
MNDEEKSYLVKPHDPAEIIRSENSAALTQFLNDAPSTIAGALIEAFSRGPSALTGPLIRVGIAALRGQRLQQFAQEIKDLQAKGKLTKDFAKRKNGYQTWVELIQVIDEDTPDEDRLDALKAMFFTANKINATDGEQIVSYQLFQIAKRLNSNELLVLKSVYECFKKETQFRNNSFRDWAQAVTAQMGHSVWSLVELADKTLVDMQLLTSRQYPDLSAIHNGNWRLTDLALKFCQNIERYHIEKTEEP